MEDNKKNDKKEEEIIVEETIDEEGDFSFQEKINKIQEKLKKCQELKEEYLDGWQRAKADLINARKDDERRNQEFLKFANAALIFEILPVLDSFDLAFASEDSKFSKGIFLIKMQLEDVLKKYGLEVIKSVGEKFNLQLHEIVQEVESEKEEGIIAEEIQKGYLLNGKVLRPARVKINKKKA
ncbi:MAG: nucleotide exchange factor GrpE [Candidatus Tagabacteria bacterium]